VKNIAPVIDPLLQFSHKYLPVSPTVSETPQSTIFTNRSITKIQLQIAQLVISTKISEWQLDNN